MNNNTRDNCHYKLDILVDKIDNLKLSVDVLKARIVPDVAKPCEAQPSDERVAQLFVCKSLRDILDSFCELSYMKTECLIICDLCYSEQQPGGCVSGQFKYRPDGDAKSFSHLKSHIKEHFSKIGHIENWTSWKKSEEERGKLLTRNHEVGMRCARICYDNFKNGKSVRSYEEEMVKAVLNGCDMGDLNHSKNFPDKFRPYVANEVKNRKIKFLSTRLPQTGFLPAICLQADKGTTVHTTRQFTTAAAVVPGAEDLITIIYLGQPVVKNHSGRGVSESMVGQLKIVRIQSSQLESGSFDGQYFHLGVPSHLTELMKLPEQFLCTWDPLHKIGVTETHIRKDSNFSWLVVLTETCQKFIESLIGARIIKH